MGILNNFFKKEAPLLGLQGLGGGLGFLAGGGAPESSIIPYGLDQSSDGNTDFLNRNYTASAAGRRTWTFASWIKKDTSSTLWLVGALGNSNNHFNFRIGSAGAFEAYQYEFSAQYGTFNLNTAGTAAMDGNWHHVIMNYDSTQSTNSDRVRFFLDGSEVSITTSSWPALNQYTTFADGGNNSYIGRNGYTDAYTTDMKWADTYLAHGKRYDETKFLTASGNPKDFDTVLGGESDTTWAGGFAFKYANSSNFGVNSLTSGTNWTSNGYSSGDQLTNVDVS
jgi:hypothetical protein|tara:strand:+ start:767 stop:1606 length:840 start_codon:yes stop_codon:yes gene_type:complete